MVGLGSIFQRLVFAARPEYLSLTYHYISGCPKYKGTTRLHIPTTIYSNLVVYNNKVLVDPENIFEVTFSLRMCSDKHMLCISFLL